MANLPELAVTPSRGHRNVRYYEKSKSPDFLLGLSNQLTKTAWVQDEEPHKGGYGFVYRIKRKASEGGSNETRALKLIPKQFLQTEYDLNSWKEELKALVEFAKPNHQITGHFVDFYGWFQTPEAYCFVMDFFDLGNLETCVGTAMLSEKETILIAVQILKGLKIMHGLNYAHRDLKPQNVLIARLGPQWWIRLADFGFAKQSIPGMGYKTNNIGTSGYTAPEVISFINKDDRNLYTDMVDIWSSGCVIFKLLTSKVPFTDGQLARYWDGTHQFPWKELETIVSKETIVVVKKMLNRDAAKRPTASKACDALLKVWKRLHPEEPFPVEQKRKDSKWLSRGVNHSQQKEKIQYVLPRLGDLRNAKDAIHEATIRGDVKMVEALLNLGVDANVMRRLDMSKDNQTPIAAAINRNKETWIGVVNLLLEGGCDINEPKDGDTPLHAASRIGSAEKVQYLLKHGAEIEPLRYCKGMNPLHIASIHGHCNVAEILLNEGVPIDGPAIIDISPTPLHLAIHNGKVKMVDFLLDRGASTALRTVRTGRTPAHIAVVGLEQVTPRSNMQESLDIFITLLLKDVRAIHSALNDVDSFRRTPLHYVAEFGLIDHARILEISCPDPQKALAATYNGLSAYEIARREGKHDVGAILKRFATNGDMTKDERVKISYGLIPKSKKLLQNAFPRKDSLQKDSFHVSTHNISPRARFSGSPFTFVGKQNVQVNDQGI